MPEQECQWLEQEQCSDSEWPTRVLCIFEKTLTISPDVVVGFVDKHVVVRFEPEDWRYGMFDEDSQVYL